MTWLFILVPLMVLGSVTAIVPLLRTRVPVLPDRRSGPRKPDQPVLQSLQGDIRAET